MNEEKIGHLAKLPIDAIDEEVSAEPNVYCSESELSEMLKDLRRAVDERNYQPQAPTEGWLYIWFRGWEYNFKRFERS